MRSSPSLTRLTWAGLVMPSSSSTPSRRRRIAAGDGSPSTRARYSLAIPELGWVSRCASRPSLVRIEQTFGVHVETTDREDPHRALHQVEHRGAALGIGRGRHDAVGFVEQEVDGVLRGGRQRAVDADDLDVAGRRGCPVRRRARRS